MSDLERLIAELGLSLPTEELARVVKGAEDDRAAAARLRTWLAAEGRA